MESGTVGRLASSDKAQFVGQITDARSVRTEYFRVWQKLALSRSGASYAAAPCETTERREPRGCQPLVRDDGAPRATRRAPCETARRASYTAAPRAYLPAPTFSPFSIFARPS
jgi:hypothetical protein